MCRFPAPTVVTQFHNAIRPLEAIERLRWLAEDLNAAVLVTVTEARESVLVESARQFEADEISRVADRCMAAHETLLPWAREGLLLSIQGQATSA
ncbi:MAG: hypothetical protein ACN0LA_00100 [Candidatus Longimicrobiales bacterium M2_2A_002]